MRDDDVPCLKTLNKTIRYVFLTCDLTAHERFGSGN